MAAPPPRTLRGRSRSSVLRGCSTVEEEVDDASSAVRAGHEVDRSGEMQEGVHQEFRIAGHFTGCYGFREEVADRSTYLSETVLLVSSAR